MRQAIFRGKRVDNGEWVYGKTFKIVELGQVFISPFGSNIYDGSGDSSLEKNFNGKFIIIEAVEILPETLGQSIELSDKNNLEIYEGDIISILTYSYDEPENSFIGEVVYGYTSFCLRGEDGTGKKITYVPLNDLHGSYTDDIDVLGNIYDNPELLTGD